MTTRRNFLIGFGVSLLAAPLAAFSQQPRTYRVGLISAASVGQSTTVRGFAQGMETLGWIDGKNIYINCRFAEGDPQRMPQLAADLVKRLERMTYDDSEATRDPRPLTDLELA